MCALLCTDDTDCSQMSWQHIHSAGGDKEVLSGARGQGRGGDGMEGGRGEEETQIEQGIWREEVKLEREGGK